MGKFQSKHAGRRSDPEGEYYLVNARILPGTTLAGDTEENAPLIQDMSEHTLSCKGSTERLTSSVPVRVVLPVGKGGVNAQHVLNMEGTALSKRKDLNDTDTTDDNVADTMNVEEFECGVSVSSADRDRQEWSFTLYDFDGRGKVTKEDLARLLQSLYTAVGSSINLPQNGTKTLKLRLSVTPDSSKAVAGGSQAKKNGKQGVIGQSGGHKHKSNKSKNVNHHAQNSLRGAPTQKEVKQNNLWQGEDSQPEKSAQLQCMDIRNNLSLPTATVASSGSPGRQTAPVPTVPPAVPPHVARLSMADHRQLTEIVQRNMEQHRRNSKSHKNSRKHSSDRVPSASAGVSSNPANNRNSTINVESPERRNYYLDLAGVENYQADKKHNSTAPPGTLSTTPARHAGKSSESRHRSSRGSNHRHSRAEPAAAKQEQPRTVSFETQVETVAEQTIEVLNRSLDIVGVPVDQPPTTGTPEASPISPGLVRSPHPGTAPCPQHTSTPTKPVSRQRSAGEQRAAGETAVCSPHHHRRHRHREKNQTRAMRQVAEWIDREHIGAVPPAAQAQAQVVPAPVTTTVAYPPEADDQTKVLVQRHEHHHIHEHHHHHHYHHYHES